MPGGVKPSEDYLVLLSATREFHKKSKLYSGLFIRFYISAIKELVDRLGCKTMLDYGCGKGVQWETPYSPEQGRFVESGGIPLAEHFGVAVTKYDPGVVAFSKEPRGKYDIVICTQVLGAVSKVDVPWVVHRLFSLADKAIFISCRSCDVQGKKRFFRKYKDLMAAGWSREEFVTAIKQGGEGMHGVECWFEAPMGSKPERLQ